MILPDINVLVYAHRSDSPWHSQAHQEISNLISLPASFALCSHVCSGFIRIVTNHRIFTEPTSLEVAISFLDSLLDDAQCRIIEPGPNHWVIFRELLKQSRVNSNLVSDAYLAAIAVEHGCELLTSDTDFHRFPNLKIRKLS